MRDNSSLPPNAPADVIAQRIVSAAYAAGVASATTDYGKRRRRDAARRAMLAMIAMIAALNAPASNPNNEGEGG